MTEKEENSIEDLYAELREKLDKPKDPEHERRAKLGAIYWFSKEEFYSVRMYCEEKESLIHAQTNKDFETFIHFSGLKSPFSLAYPCQVKMREKEFMSAEHALHYLVAFEHTNEEQAEEIAQSSSPEQYKEITRDLEIFFSPYFSATYAEWLREVNSAKFSQWPELCDRLLETSGNTLVDDDREDYFLGLVLYDHLYCMPGNPEDLYEYDRYKDGKYDFIKDYNVLGLVLTVLRMELQGHY